MEDDKIQDYLFWLKQQELEKEKFLKAYEESKNQPIGPGIPRSDRATEAADFPCSRLYRDYIEDLASKLGE